MRILVIDDYRPHGESLQDLLEAQGHEAHYAESYDGAQAYLASIRFDLAFLDFDMPLMPGPVVAARLGERFPRIRSVIVTARALSPERLEEEDNLLYLPKPVSVAALRDCLVRIEREMTQLSVSIRGIFPLARPETTGTLALVPLPSSDPQRARGLEPRRDSQTARRVEPSRSPRRTRTRRPPRDGATPSR